MYSHYEIWAIAQERQQQVLKEAAQVRPHTATTSGFATAKLPSQSPAAAARIEVAYFGLTMRHML